MKNPFTRNGKTLKDWDNTTNQLMDALTEIRTGEHSLEDLREFCEGAIVMAEARANEKDMLFWGYDKPWTMDSDACDEFFSLPSYVMVQCLIAAILKQPALMRQYMIRDVLERGLNGCMLGGLGGHGYDAEDLLFENTEMFLKAGYAEFAIRYPDVCPAFRKLVEDWVIEVRHDYAKGNHIYGQWPVDKTRDQEEIICLADGWLIEGDEEITKPSERWYIAYGSNMSEAQMRERCPGAKLVGIGKVKAKRLEFYLYATLVDTDNETDEVPVSVWRITPEDEATLDRYEGVKGGYYQKDQTVAMLNNGVQVLGLIYLMDKIRIQPVTDRYYNGIAAAYDRLGLHDKIAEVLEPARERSLKL